MLNGSCHCGAVSFAVDAPVENTITCNCSMCGRAGSILMFVPEEKMNILSGEEQLTDYQFGKKHIHHTFCKTCGIKPFGHGTNPEDGSTMYAINLRCCEGVDVEALEPTMYDGKSL